MACAPLGPDLICKFVVLGGALLDSPGARLLYCLGIGLCFSLQSKKLSSVVVLETSLSSTSH